MIQSGLTQYDRGENDGAGQLIRPCGGCRNFARARITARFKETREGLVCSRPFTKEAASVYLTDSADNDKLKAMFERM